jgi:hypothetical protein
MMISILIFGICGIVTIAFYGIFRQQQREISQLKMIIAAYEVDGNE